MVPPPPPPPPSQSQSWSAVPEHRWPSHSHSQSLSILAVAPIQKGSLGRGGGGCVPPSFLWIFFLQKQRNGHFRDTHFQKFLGACGDPPPPLWKSWICPCLVLVIAATADLNETCLPLTILKKLFFNSNCFSVWHRPIWTQKKSPCSSLPLVSKII